MTEATGPVFDQRLAQRVAEARLMRHQVFAKKTEQRFRFLIHEPILQQEVGGAEVRAGQFERLLEIMEYPKVQP